MIGARTGRALVTGAWLLAAGGAAAAQALPVQDLRDELSRIRDATNLQAQGDLGGAERVIREVIGRNPTSLTGLLLLEQLLSMQDRLSEVLPLVDELIRLDPTSAIGHQMRARVFARLGQTEELERAGSAWIGATPRLETPYREIARLWLERQDFERALRVLELGRSRVNTAGALALELGDANLAAGSLQQAVREWDRAIGPNGQGLIALQRRLRAMPDGGSAASPLLVRSLMDGNAAIGRQRAALQLALDAGLGAEAERIAPAVLATLPPAEREAFLTDVGRRADAAGLARVGYWGYSELIEMAPGGSERLLALRTRLAQLALAAGDTAGAAAAFQLLEATTPPGSPQRRQAVAVRIRLAAQDSLTSRAVTELRAFRAEFPDAPELDETAAAVGEALLAVGDVDGAEQVMLGVRGPRTAVARGRAFLRRGDLARAGSEFMLAAPSLHGREATVIIALAAALTRISSAGGELLGSAVTAMAEDPAAALNGLLQRSASLPSAERAAVLDFAAGRADEAGLPEVGEQARRILVEAAPRSDVAPAALFWLGQRASRRPEQQEEAMVLFERLIVDYPRSALVPQARRELERISGRLAAPASSKAGAL